MNTKQDEALSMERALKMAQDWYDSDHEDPDEFTEMIKQVIALALVNKVDQEQPAPVAEPHKQQEPVSLEDSLKESKVCCGDYANCHRACTPRGRWEALRLVETAQLSKPWVGLTDEDKLAIRKMPWEFIGDLIVNTEAKLREKNGGAA